MPLLTTTIGSYPKPVGVATAGGFDADQRTWRSTLTATEHRLDMADTAALDRAVHEVVAEQAAVGIDIPTDGELRREHYLYDHLRHLDGFDFHALAPKIMRDGGWQDLVPVVRARVAAGEPFLARQWQVAQSATERPVKVTVPGPLTATASTEDEFYDDARTLGKDLAAALNVEIRRVTAAGCRYVQLDEPVFARQPDDALGWGIELVERCFHGVPDGVQRIVHVCCGYPSTLDQEDYPKADPGNYAVLADALDAASIDAVSIEDAHRPNDLGLLERFRATTVILGLVDIARTRLEPLEQLRQRLLAALEHIDADRLVAAPDCGLVMLGRELAVAKLDRLVAAARAVP